MATPIETQPERVSSTPPGPKGLPFLGSVLDMRRQGPLAFYTAMWRQYGDAFHHHVGNIPVYVFIHPRDVEYVVYGHAENYDKNTIIELRARRVIPESLLMSDDAHWAHLREIMNPPFSREAVPQFHPSMVESTQMLLNRWNDVARHGEMVDMVDEMKLLSFSMISRFIFGEDLTQEASGSRQAINFLMGYVQNSILAAVDIPPSIPTPQNRRFQAATAELDQFVRRHIQWRRDHPDDAPSDLIGYLLSGRDAHGASMTDEEIRDQALATFIAGQQMMGLTLAWAWYELSRHPQVEEALHAELAQILNGREPTMDDIPRLDQTRRIIEETMRLYPTVWIMARTSHQDDTISGYRVPAGATIALIPYLTHRHSEFWKDPETFDPDRLLPERVKDLPRLGFLPFGGGRRKCVGNKYSLQAFVVALATLAQHFRPRLKPGHRVEPIAIAAVQPRNGFPSTLDPR